MLPNFPAELGWKAGKEVLGLVLVGDLSVTGTVVDEMLRIGMGLTKVLSNPGGVVWLIMMIAMRILLLKVACQHRKIWPRSQTGGEVEMCSRSYTLTLGASEKDNRHVHESREVMEEYAIPLVLILTRPIREQCR